jgi:hypothetical protein
MPPCETASVHATWLPVDFDRALRPGSGSVSADIADPDPRISHCRGGTGRHIDIAEGFGWYSVSWGEPVPAIGSMIPMAPTADGLVLLVIRDPCPGATITAHGLNRDEVLALAEGLQT